MTFGGASKIAISSFTSYFCDFSTFIFFIITMVQSYCCRGSPNIEMDEHTFMVNRERAVDYLNSLDKVNCFPIFHIFFFLQIFSIHVEDLSDSMKNELFLSLITKMMMTG